MLFNMEPPKESDLRTWGGKRKGAGRPRKVRREKKGATHLARAPFPGTSAVHITWRMKKRVWRLLTPRCLELLKKDLVDATKSGFRVIHHAMQANDLHLLAEADDEVSLSRGMQGLGIRIARALNRELKRKGSIFDDRFHAQLLQSATEVKHVRHYLLDHARQPGASAGSGEPVSAEPLVAPQTPLLRALLVTAGPALGGSGENASPSNSSDSGAQ
jgi:REP-associated tyrosine transposase